MAENHKLKSDVAIIGGGLAGIAAANEMLDRNLKVLILDRDDEIKFGGLARESFGGVMMVDTPLQKKSGIKDTPGLALSDWESVAGFSGNDVWPQKWAETYVNRSGDLIWEWLSNRGVEFLPVVNWPERGLFRPGNSVPRWHIAWGTGKALMEAVIGHLDNHPKRKNLTLCFRHKVEGFITENGSVTGCFGTDKNRDRPFEVNADAVLAASGGMCGGDLSKVRENWYKPWGTPPDNILNGSHIYADGLIHDQVSGLGGNITHLDKQWNYAAGIPYPGSERHNHGLSLVPPKSALWVNAEGSRIGPVPLMGYTDTRYVVKRICAQPGQYSWLIMNWKIAIKELAVSGCDYMTAFREKDKIRLIKEVLFGNKTLVSRLINESDSFITASSVKELAGKMNRLETSLQVNESLLAAEINAYDSQIDRGPAYFNDDQLRRIANYRKYRGDRLRTCKFQKINDPKALPLIAVRQFILSRKSLGGIQTDLSCRVLSDTGTPIPGLYAAGEAAGFGGGGIHGKGSLEGTFLGSCILTGRIAGAAVAGDKIV